MISQDDNQANTLFAHSEVWYASLASRQGSELQCGRESGAGQDMTHMHEGGKGDATKLWLAEACYLVASPEHDQPGR
eukprot:48836-Eustigmatos_ZCMA.PRE.1